MQPRCQVHALSALAGVACADAQLATCVLLGRVLPSVREWMQWDRNEECSSRKNADLVHAGCAP
ncbi:hypothetical protein T492DRAFT_886176 [Pavlovales sp. CCMP2436]|nr:hypothetical protein T492DRAFT_886176 [Pavlovales sp. CCMP2436]